jgi:hypothetical protein
MIKLVLKIYFILNIVLSSCVMDKKGMYKEILITNNTKDSFIVINSKPIIFDSVLPIKKPGVIDQIILPPFQSNIILLTAWASIGLEDYIKVNSKYNYLCYYVISKTKFETISWDSLIANQINYRKYIVSTPQINNQSNLLLNIP